ncbi:unnamed protein product, partial [Ixodes hexagonus]
WYPLKDTRLSKNTGGYILLEVDLIYNPFKAAIQSFREKAPPPQALACGDLSRHALTRNVSRCHVLYRRFKEIKTYVRSCFTWESTPRSVISLVIFVWLSLCLQLYMIPWLLVALFCTDLLVFSLWSSNPIDESKQSLKRRLTNLQDAAASMQNAMGKAASYGERLRK